MSFTRKGFAKSPLATRSTSGLWLLLGRMFADPFTSAFNVCQFNCFSNAAQDVEYWALIVPHDSGFARSRICDRHGWDRLKRSTVK